MCSDMPWLQEVEKKEDWAGDRTHLSKILFPVSYFLPLGPPLPFQQLPIMPPYCYCLGWASEVSDWSSFLVYWTKIWIKHTEVAMKANIHCKQKYTPIEDGSRPEQKNTRPWFSHLCCDLRQKLGLRGSKKGLRGLSLLWLTALIDKGVLT
jgi:hypothetical protein